MVDGRQRNSVQGAEGSEAAKRVNELSVRGFFTQGSSKLNELSVTNSNALLKE